MIFSLKRLVISVCFCSSLTAMAGSWNVILQQNDPMATNESYYATSDSFLPIKNLSFPYTDARSWIGVGCNTDNQYWAFIGFNKANFTGGEWKRDTKNHLAKIKYDDQISQVNLSESSGGQNFLNVSTTDKNTFIKGLKSSNSVITGVPWYGQGDVWFKYSMKGSAKAIDIIFDKCGIGASQEKSTVVSQRPPKNGDWTLLIATFKSLDNASKLIEKLNAYGHPAYLKTKDNLFVVSVGTGILRKDAELFKEKIKDEFSLNGIVVMYSGN